MRELSLNLFQRAVSVGEGGLARIQNLNSGIMFAVERSDKVWAASLYHISRTVKPKAEMISLDRIGWRVLGGIRDGAGFIERVGRSRRNTRRDAIGPDWPSATPVVVSAPSP